MRFLADGPSIPDELLLARDQGRVVFFCGAGVSMARAKLPDFFGLAQAVTKSLGVPTEHPALKILDEARVIGARTGVDGLISADRIFGLLERDFLVADIETAVALAIKPHPEADLSAHETLLDLATTQEGLVRLVTTNFDRLFDRCRVGLPTFEPSHLPDPARPSQFHGLVYLHGRSSSAYDGVEGDGLILSSSDFGRAYLSDGWATRFFREIIDRYFVVFVGYAADDPPVHYLLEALNKTSGRLGGVYAFQSGDENYANSRWSHKGVEAIPYDGARGHAALWSTLESWAARARSPKAWTNGIVKMATAGPEKLQAHQRGQVAHVVSTAEGCHAFSQSEGIPPSSWLCVFDPLRRYAKPGRGGGLGERGPYLDPFDLFGLDCDIAPNKIDPEDHYAKREAPRDAWDAFVQNKLDKASLRDENYGSFRGPWATSAPALPPRLTNLGIWVSRVAAQPGAIWWAARQTSLHPRIREMIRWQLDRLEDLSPEIETAWRYLLDFWNDNHTSPDPHWFRLAKQIKESGWDRHVVRKLAAGACPYLVVKENFWSAPAPSSEASSGSGGNLIRLDVEYPDLPTDIEIPDQWLNLTVVCLRRNLEVALELETEIGGFGLDHICPIHAEDNPAIDGYERSHGLSGWVLHFVRAFERLRTLNPDAAKAEFARWPADEESIFGRLRIWGAGKSDLVPDRAFADLIHGLPDDVFWGERHARDLLITLATRWDGQNKSARKAIERRILNGPHRWQQEDDEHYKERKAWYSLNRLNWMNSNGLSLIHDIALINSKLCKLAPEWKLEYAEGAARSLEGRGGWVRKETEHSALIMEPLDTTLVKATELSGHRGELVEYDPFAGLSELRPIRAFAVLRRAAKRNEYPEWAWRTYLSPDRRKNDKPRLTALVGEQILRYKSADIEGFVRAAANWYQRSAAVLAANYPELFSRLAEKLIDVLSRNPAQSSSGIVRGSNRPDWTMESINSPTGDVAEALFDNVRGKNLKVGDGLPIVWRTHAGALLALPGDLRRHGLVIFAHNLSWFFAVDPAWTKDHLLRVLESDCEFDKQALWSGFLWGGRAEGYELFSILKPHMLRLAKSKILEKQGHAETLTGMLLSAWQLLHKETRWITNEELRDVLLNSDDEFRSRALWQAEKWWGDDDDGEKPDGVLPLVELLRDVWPRQIAAKSPIISARLCDLAFSSEKHFPVLVDLILPLLSKADGAHFSLPQLRRSESKLVDMYPEQTLILLYAVLPDNIAAWPYGIEAALMRIAEADKRLANDGRLLELRRKWDSR